VDGRSVQEAHRHIQQRAHFQEGIVIIMGNVFVMRQKFLDRIEERLLEKEDKD